MTVWAPLGLVVVGLILVVVGLMLITLAAGAATPGRPTNQPTSTG